MKINYEKYDLSIKEWIIYILLGIFVDILVSYLFYKSFLAFFILSPAIGFYIKKQKEQLCKNRKKELSSQFKEAIYAISASLNAGYSIENAFIEAYKDLRTIFGEEEIIVKEFKNFTYRLSMNETLESILQDFAIRSGQEDIEDFADVFITAKRSGGDMVSIIRKTVEHISEKMEVKREIETLMSAKKMEQNIMSIVPFIILFYLSISSSGFLDVLYGNFLGIIVMSSCLAIYLCAFFMAQRIVNIEV